VLNITTSPFSVSTIGAAGLGARLSGLDFQPGTSNLFATSGKGGTNHGHLFSINVATGEATEIGDTNFGGVSGLAIDSDGTFYASASETTSGNDLPDRLITIDPITGEGTEVGIYGNSGSAEIDGIDALAFDPISGTLYGSGVEPGYDQLITIDKTTGAATVLGQLTQAGSGGTINLPEALVGLAFDSSGNLFGSVGAGDGQIVSIDIGNLEFTILGDAATGSVSDIAFYSTTTAIPEPSSFALLGIGLAGIVGWRRRK
jgi:hypothetical protein